MIPRSARSAGSASFAPFAAFARSAPRRAFTLLELIITIGLIMLLASIIIVTLGSVRGGANRAQSSNALRQIMVAYNGYSTDNKAQLMPGYADAPMLRQLGIAPKIAEGIFLDPHLAPASTIAPTDPNDASSYVWRLAPYLGDEWQMMMVDYRSRELNARLATERAGDKRLPCDTDTDHVFGPGSALVAACNDLGISRIPSYGLNSIYVGGDNVHGGNEIIQRNPWDNPGNKLAATRQSEVRNPARIIVFAPTVHWNLDTGFPNPPVSEVRFGSPALRPPVVRVAGVDRVQWNITENQVVIEPGADFSAGGGVPVARAGRDLIPLAHLDGSVTTETLVNIALDPKKWSPFEVGFP